LERIGSVAIVGVGLIGGSVGLALRERGLAERVIGVGRDATRLAVAERTGALDSWTTDLARCAAEADVVVVCTPVTQIARDAVRTAECGPEHLLVTDAGSTKRAIVEAVERHPRGRAMFVGAHPIAGSERKGVAFARGDLFEGRVCVLTPTERTARDRIDRACAFWSGLGCRVVEMEPKAHDEALAFTSHLPHAVAAALAATVPAEYIHLGAGAYRDGTRVANADAALWAPIFRENRAAVQNALALFHEELAAFEAALESDDPAALRDWWAKAQSRRGLFDALNPAPAIEPAASDS
jgi:prephenate dehydrogenase